MHFCFVTEIGFAEMFGCVALLFPSWQCGCSSRPAVWLKSLLPVVRCSTKHLDTSRVPHQRSKWIPRMQVKQGN